MKNNPSSRKKQAKVLRSVRKVHRYTGLFLFVFFFIIAITGLLLGWKKDSAGLILAPTMKGSSTNMEEWISLDSIYHIATQHITTQHPDQANTVHRLEVRPSKGIVKITYKDHYTGLQIDGATGELLLVERRNSDLIEQIHDGSIVDRYLGIPFKLLYTSIMGIALIIFTITGFWLWYGPRRMRQ